MCGEADEHRDNERGILDFPAQLRRTRVSRADVDDRVATAGLEREAVGHLQRALGFGARRRIGFRFQQFEPALRQADGFLVRVEPGGGLRGAVPVTGGPDVVARRFEEERHIAGVFADFVPKSGDQPLGNRTAQRGPASGAQ